MEADETEYVLKENVPLFIPDVGGVTIDAERCSVDGRTRIKIKAHSGKKPKIVEAHGKHGKTAAILTTLTSRGPVR